MKFDPDNKIVQYCAEGMNLEVKGKAEEAYNLFQQAWEEAKSDLEKFTAAHGYGNMIKAGIQHGIERLQ